MWDEFCSVGACTDTSSRVFGGHLRAFPPLMFYCTLHALQ